MTGSCRRRQAPDQDAQVSLHTQPEHLDVLTGSTAKDGAFPLPENLNTFDTFDEVRPSSVGNCA
jgi:hypothetical protein